MPSGSLRSPMSAISRETVACVQSNRTRFKLVHEHALSAHVLSSDDLSNSILAAIAFFGHVLHHSLAVPHISSTAYRPQSL